MTPITIPEIKAGSYELTIRRERYKDEVVSVMIEPGKTRTVDTKLTALTGILYISGLTEGAEVYLDGKRVFPENYRLNNVIIGSHKVVVKRKGYYDNVEYVEVLSGRISDISGNLEEIVIKIPYAKIKVDGKLGDWAGISPVLTDPAGDLSSNYDSGKYKGTDVTKLFLAKDNTKLYVRMEFANGKPRNTDVIYDFFLRFGKERTRERAEIRLIGYLESKDCNPL